MLTQLNFKNANEAFLFFFDELNNNYEEESNGTRQLRNVGFYIQDPEHRIVSAPFRKWKRSYAEKEWAWYMSGDPSAFEISKHAKIWKQCMDKDGNVNSNYGYQWKRGNQIDYVLNELRRNPNSRRASISIYDAKDRHNFENDTPCTYAINFYIKRNQLNMSVMMRSNDLWFGFCNDQYCFANLQIMIADTLSLRIGTYYHFVNNLHLYERHYLDKAMHNSRGERIVVGDDFYVSSIIHMPINVNVTKLDFEERKAQIRNSEWLELDRLYKNKDECPQR